MVTTRTVEIIDSINRPTGLGSSASLGRWLVVEAAEVSVEGFDDALVAGCFAVPSASLGVGFEFADVVELCA